MENNGFSLIITRVDLLELLIRMANYSVTPAISSTIGYETRDDG